MYYRLVTLRKNKEITLVLPDGRPVVIRNCPRVNGSARVGITAPKDVAVDRAEVHEQKQEKRRET